MRAAALREHAPSILVASLSAAFGATLLQVSQAVNVMIGGDEIAEASSSAGLMLALVAGVFIVIAIYVGAVVTTNTFATIIAGRTRTIALMRLIGSSAISQRRAVAREGLLIGVIGAITGVLAGTALTWLLVTVLIATDTVPSFDYNYLQPVVLLPAVAVLLTTWIASWVGSRRVLTVSPIQATGAAQERSSEQVRARTGRNIVAIVLFSLGIIIMLLGVFVGLGSPFGVLIAMGGGVMSFTGLVLGAHLAIPPVLRLVGRLFGARPAARLASENAVRYPERSARNLIGLVIGITLVTMFSVAIGSFQSLMRGIADTDPAVYDAIDETLTITVIVFSALTGFSALIAAVGMVNNLSLSVLQRTRELGLLRALGFTAAQVRRMILVESVQLTAAAVVIGLLLGTFYGWAGAQSLFGSISGGAGLIMPTVPLSLVATVLGAATILALGASVVPARRATAVSPVTALADQ
ncbi:MAG: transporter permease [Glaciihabitans sp.]|nr:transporter permease [Glaciihabitans sp.]